MIGIFEENKIYNDDSYKAIKNIPDKSIDCIYTDIPYLYEQGGSNYEPKEDSSGIMKRIHKNAIEIIDISNGINNAILDEFVRVMKKINIFIWCSKLQILDLMKYFIDEKGCRFEILTWCKTNPTPSTNNKFLPDIEYCLYFREKGVPLNDGYELKSKWYIDSINKKDKDKFYHPTCKPVTLVERHIRHATQEGDLVADFFIGSGTTAVACANSNRKYIGFEINEEYYKIACDRLNCVDAKGQTSMFLI